MTLEERKAKLDQITDKGIMGEKLTPEETEFLHSEMKKNTVSNQESLKKLKKLEQHQKKYGPTSVVFLPNEIINPETRKPVTTLSEYIKILEKESKNANY